MNRLVEEKRAREERCEDAVARGAYGEGAREATRTAELGFRLAEQTGGAIAEAYLADAEEWVEIAERLDGMKAKGVASGKAAGKGAVEEKDGGADSEWLVSEKPSVRMEDIVGMADAKQAVLEMIVYPLQHPEQSRAMKLWGGGGVLVFGPPGNGKTLLGKAIAGELECPFYYASGAQIRSKWHGESEQRLSKLIHEARANPVAILFLDEVEGLLPRRGGGGSAVDNRIVTQFLADIGGFEESGNVLMVLGATNRPWDIDDAVFRTGRFDEKIYVGPPDVAAREAILRGQVEGVPIEDGFDAGAWAKRLELYSGSDLVGLVRGAKRMALGRAVRENGAARLRREDLENALKRIPASTTSEMLAEYDRFAKRRGCGN